MCLQLSAAVWSHYPWRNDECNRLFVRRAHLSVFPPSWGCRGTVPACSNPLATPEHWSPRRLRDGPLLQVRVSSDGWEGVVGRSDMRGHCLPSPQISVPHTLPATLGVSPSVTGKDSPHADHPPLPREDDCRQRP